ncbi:MAG: hypothetical protein ACYC7J_03705 [Syntrophales bacterium]
MRGMYYWWGFTTGEVQSDGAEEGDAVRVPAPAFIPQVKISDRYTGRSRWTGPEPLWVAPAEKPLPKK